MGLANMGLANEGCRVSLWTLDTPPTSGRGVESKKLTEDFRGPAETFRDVYHLKLERVTLKES